MLKLVALLGFISKLCFAATIFDGDLIVVHPSKHYHTNPDTIIATNKLIQKFDRSVMLYQFEPADDPLWYADLKLGNQIYVYSRSGENKLSLSTKSSSIEITMAGGYLTSCLGRAVADVMATFLKSKNLKTLKINLESAAIFTGHLKQNQSLVPKTPYAESILDDSVDGLNFSEVLLVLNGNNRSYFSELLKIGFIKNAPMMVKFDYNYRINVRLNHKSILTDTYTYQGVKDFKKIIVEFTL